MEQTEKRGLSDPFCVRPMGLKRKAYVTVNVDQKPDGTWIPRKVWLPGEEEACTISRVWSARRRVSQETGGKGICFSVTADGKRTDLYYEGNGRWFLIWS